MHLLIELRNINNIKAQGSCNSATNITLSTNMAPVQLTSNSNEYWFNFTAVSTNLIISIDDINYDISQIEVYQGGCNSMTTIKTSTNNSILLSNLTINNSYLVKLTSNSNSGNFSLLFSLSFPIISVNRNNSNSNMGSSQGNVCEGDILRIKACWGNNNYYPKYYRFYIDGLPPITTSQSPNGSNCSKDVFFIVPSLPANTTFYITTGVSSDGNNFDSLFTIHAFGANRKHIRYNSIPNSSFTLSPNPACPLENVSANIQAAPPYSGDWGDGTALTSFNGGNQPHPYQQAGIYNANIISTNMCGTSSSQTTINVEITPDFTFFNQCVGNTVNFNDATTCSNVIADWQWDFGDGMGVVYSSSQNPSHTYSNPGTYTVTLKVKTNYNAPSTGQPEMFSISKQVIIYPKPALSSIVGINNSCDGVDDISYSIDNYNSNFTYNWSISQGSGTYNNTNSVTANGQSNTIDWTNIPSLPSHAQIQVETTDNNGCVSITKKNIFECCYKDVDDVFNNTSIEGGGISYSGKQVIVNGILTINTDVIFDQSTIIYMGPEAKIVVAQGKTLELNNSIIKNNCNYMWDGIYANGGSSYVEFDNSEMRDAINGIVVDNGAVVYLKNSEFINNYKSVQINNYIPNILNPVPYSGQIYNSKFYTENDVMNNGSMIIPANDADYTLDIAPLNGKQAFAAIILTKVGLVNIGDASKNQNIFAKQQYGIYAKTSNPTIKNNKFLYIKKKYFNGQYEIHKLPQSAAIYGIFYNKRFPLNGISKTITLGDQSLTGSSYSNYFDECQIGILTKNYRNKIYKNKFLKSSNTAICMYDMASGGDIQYNYINNNSSYLNSRGIYGANTTQRRLILNIENNLVYNMKHGISLINCNSFNFSNSSYKVKVHNNYILLNPTGNKKYYAIRAASCDRIEIAENTITRIGNSSSSDATKVVGISLRQTQSAKVTDNYIYRMGSGIMTNGAMYNTQFFCNTFSHNYNGFYFGDKTGLTNFGWKGLSGITDFNPQNKWMYNIGEKMYNDNIISTSVDYYYYDQNSSIYSLINDPEISPFQYPSCVGKINPVSSNSASFYCSNSSGPNIIIKDDEISSDVDRDELLEEFLIGESYSELQDEFRNYEIDYLYKILDNDQSIMWLGGSKDVDYRAFYNQIQNSINAKFIDIDNLIAEGNFAEAYQINNDIIANTNLESNRKMSNKIYLETYINDNYLLEESTIATLNTIANQTPYEGGYGVYTARVMLDFDPDNNDVSWRIGNTAKQKQETSIRVFPNPTKDILYVEVMNDLDNYNAIIQIYNTIGQLVAEQQMTQKMEFISLRTLKTGMYIYNIKYDNGYTEKGKFIVQQ